MTGWEPFLRLAPALAQVSADGEDAGRRALEALAADLATLERDEHWLLLVALLGLVACRLGAKDCAERLYALLLPYRHLLMSHDLLRTVAASAEGALGLLAATSGRADDAVSHLETALDREQALGLRPVALRTRLLLADALSRRGRPGDPARAEALRRDAEREAHGLGCPLPAGIDARSSGPPRGG